MVLRLKTQRKNGFDGQTELKRFDHKATIFWNGEQASHWICRFCCKDWIDCRLMILQNETKNDFDWFRICRPKNENLWKTFIWILPMLMKIQEKYLNIRWWLTNHDRINSIRHDGYSHEIIAPEKITMRRQNFQKNVRNWKTRLKDCLTTWTKIRNDHCQKWRLTDVRTMFELLRYLPVASSLAKLPKI